ncbi:MAG TPA: hypothetical protein VFT72_02035 [Opitutaceae bacterium]|nr:hypothetical protein [Opitutaceae bacterium]
MLIYAITVFLGAFLLFQVQPIIGKYILPWFGGSPGVWTTCLLFFQILLLGGYAYAHFISTRFSRRRQMWIHLALLGVSLAFLPITPAESWKPQPGVNPMLGILLLLTSCIGLPYLALSATGPLVQSWFSRTELGRSPYRLYSLSNAGSLLALLSYPFFFETKFTRHEQVALWSAAMVVYAVCCAASSWRASRSPLDDVGKGEGTSGIANSNPISDVQLPPTAKHIVLWIALPALASLLLLATTNKLCQDVAVIPFLWILPLAIYLLSFIISFDHPRWYHRGCFAALVTLGASVVCALLFEGTGVNLPLQIAAYSFALFAACMVCHGELYRVKPAVAYLTKYYMLIALGGAVGGLLVAVVAPAILNRFIELEAGYWLLIYLAAVVAISEKSRVMVVGSIGGAIAALFFVPIIFAARDARSDGWASALHESFSEFFHDHWFYILIVALATIGALFGRRDTRDRAWKVELAVVPLLFTLALGFVFIVELRRDFGRVVEQTRNFYGVLTVTEFNDEERSRYSTLTHGDITHGLQFAEPPLSRFPTSYYGELSGVGLAILHVPTLGPKRIGVVGLGTGTLAAYGKPGDTIRFYDINPAVEHLARTRFTFLSESKANIEIVLGDARLSLERELSEGDWQRFDVLALDAFSSDVIPVHLLTREAFEIYLKHLAFGGIIAVHTSNRYLNLDPVVIKTATALGLAATVITDSPGDKDWWLSGSTWILLARTPDVLAIPEINISASSPPKIGPNVRAWTDDYASLYPLLR